MAVAVRSPQRQLVVATCLGLLIVVAGWPRHAACANVLAIEPVAAKSHWTFMRGVLRALVDHGHRVTVYTPFPDRASPTTENYTEVDTSGEFNTMVVNINATLVSRVFSRPSEIVPFLANSSRTVCDLVDKLVAGLADGGDKYDLLVTKPLTNECVSHAVRRLGVPFIYTIPGPLLPWIDTGMFGHYVNPSYVPHLMSPYAVPDTFGRRLHNVGLYLYTVYLHYRTTAALAAADGRPYDRLPPVKPSLVFVNTHYATEIIRPVSADRVNVGGVHLRTPEPLPADILKFIEDSPHGVIFFTFGTVVALSTLPDHIQKAFKDALAEVPQRVLLKYEVEMKDKPANMMTSKWLPQRDILMHPKVKLFISHGGISGVYETVDAGVPVLGFPLFYDQPRNIENLVEAGMAISMDLMTVTKDKLLHAINEMINNETYSRHAKITSERFKDRPMSPAKSVVYWTEYVLRHKGAPHLKSHAHNLTWYQYFLLDVVAVVLLAVLLVFYVTYKMLKCLKNCIIPKMVPRSKSKPD